MRYAAPRNWTAFLFVFLCFVLMPTSKADTFAFTVVGNTDMGSFVAADDFGDYTVRLNNLNSCGSNANSCFLTYSAYTQQTSYSSFQPELASDSSPTAGTGCTYNVAKIPGGVSFCNNGHQEIGNISGVWSVNGKHVSLVYSLGLPANTILVTPSGNFAFADGLNENLILALDLTTLKAAVPIQVTAPEPSSLCMLATGALGIVGALRRRYAA